MADARGPVEDVEHELTLPEELVLLAYDDEKGHTWSSTLDTGLGGAVMLDLSLRGRVEVREKELAVVDPTPTGEPALDVALAEVAGARRPKAPKSWLGGLGRAARPASLERLVERGVLRHDERRALGLFRYSLYPQADGGPEQRVRQRLHDAVVVGTTPDARTAALASLVKALGLRHQVFPGADRRATDRRLAELSEGAWASDAVKKAIDEMTMVVLAVTTSAAATSAASS